MRQAWNLGPLLQCCNACIWTHLTWSNKIPRNYMGLKLTVYTCRWGKFWTKDTKRPKNLTGTFEEPGAKAGYCTQHHQGHGETNLSDSPANTLTCSHTQFKKLAPCQLEIEEGNLLPLLIPLCCSISPNEAFLNSSSCLLSISID